MEFSKITCSDPYVPEKRQIMILDLLGVKVRMDLERAKKEREIVHSQVEGSLSVCCVNDSIHLRSSGTQPKELVASLNIFINR